MIRKHLFLAFVLICLLVSFISNAQSTKTEAKEVLEKMNKSLSNINTLVYKIDYTRKFLSQRDTIYTTAICSLYITPKDKMKAYNIVDLVEYNKSKWSTYGHRRYDGKRVFLTNYPPDSLDKIVKPNIYKKRRIRHAVVEGYSHLLMQEYLKQRKSSKKNQPVAENLNITEETLNDKSVYVFTLNLKDHEDIRDHVIKIYVRKLDYLPVGFYSFGRWENMEEYNYYEVEYLAINPDLPLTAFTVDENETINAEERYKTFNEKTKIKD